MTTIAFIDAYPIVGRGVSEIIEKSGLSLHCRHFVNVSSMECVRHDQVPDVLVLTINSYKIGNPVPQITQCRAMFPHLSIILYDEEHYPGRMDKWLKNDISGYLLKSEPGAMLLKCIEAVLAGERFLSPGAWERYFGISTAMVGKRPSLGHLGARETEVAEYLSDGKSTSWIARHLGKDPSTISNIKRRVFYKLEVSNVIALRTAISSMRTASRA